MYIIKNALRNITRNKMRNILLCLIFIVIASVLSITFAIKKSASDIVLSYENENNIEASIGINREKLMDDLKEKEDAEDKIDAFNDIENITIEEIKNYSNSVYVSSYYYTYDLRVNAKNIDAATSSLVKETTETKTEKNNMFNPFGKPQGEERKTITKKTKKIYNEKENEGAFNLLGYSSYSSMSDFIDGKYKIKEGNISDDFESDTCIISSELAKLNDLKIDDIITVIDPKNTKKTYKLTITGIFEEDSSSASDMRKMFTDSANTIITNINFINKLIEANDDLTATITPTFILTSQDVIDAFKEEVNKKDLNNYYEITTNEEEITEKISSIKNLETFANTFLLITFIIGGSILILINSLIIRERKYEIGVLRTIGMSKSKVSWQFVLEIFFVAFVSFIIGTGIGSTLSVNIANNLLQNEISSTENRKEDIGKNFGDKKMDISFSGGIEKIDSINAVVDFKVIVSMLEALILLTITSSLVAIVSINQFKPLTILKERG